MATTLSDLAASLRVLHRGLLQAARAEYEEQHGKITGPYALLHLASTDPSFAFLHPLSELMVDLDLLLEEQQEDPSRPEPAQAVAEELRALLGLGGENALFADRYRALMQKTPELIVDHAQLIGILRQLPVRGDDAAVMHDRHRWAMVRSHRYPDTERAATLGGLPERRDEERDRPADAPEQK